MLKRTGSFVLAAAMLWPIGGSAVETNFWCVPKALCGCNINTTRDCDLMKKNCQNGTILICAGTACYCLPSANRTIGNPPKVLPRDILTAPSLSRGRR
jgi:hypothetical protein